MKEIYINRIDEINEYWIVYVQDSGEPGHIQLSACANSYAVHRGAEDGDGLRCVGLHYEKDGCGCYELFTAGHALIKCPLKANFVQSLASMLRGKKGDEVCRQAYLDFETKLNGFGWKTIEG